MNLIKKMKMRSEKHYFIPFVPKIHLHFDEICIATIKYSLELNIAFVLTDGETTAYIPLITTDLVKMMSN